jgi:hypothetical protein
MRSSALNFFLISIACSGCVSVSLAKSEVKRATGVQITQPSKPFETESRKDVDAAWKNPKNGNLISYMTDCQDENDPGLDNIVQGALSGLTDLRYDKKESPTLDNREARRVLVSGKVDGVPSQIDLVVFKRDSCIYILSFVGVQKSFGQDQGQFDKFVEGFRAP